MDAFARRSLAAPSEDSFFFYLKDMTFEEEVLGWLPFQKMHLTAIRGMF